MGFDKKTTADASTVKGQMNTPVTSVSQPTASQPLSEQVQSVPLSQVEGRFYEITEDEILLDDTIIAKPIFTNEAYKIKPKDKHYAFRWVEYQAKGGLRYQQMKAMGFTNASEDDLLPQEQGGHQAQIDGGKLMLGDVILMKIPRGIYLAHLKANLQSSSDMLTPRKIHETAARRMGGTITGSRGMPTLETHKGDVFIPAGKDLEGMGVPVRGTTATEQKVYEVVTRD